MIEYPFEYFKDEIKEGFYVSSSMKRAWAVQLEVVQLVDDICKKHGLRWFADFGTLIGAVRHKGYIPWDDDIDICMLRDDYEKFLKIIQDDLPDGYLYRSIYTDPPFYELFAKIVYVGKSQDDPKDKWLYDFPLPVGIDIFPLDYISDDKTKEDARYHIFKTISAALYAQENDIEVDDETLISEVELLINKKIDRTLPLRQQLYICMDNVLKIFPPNAGKYVMHGPYYLKSRDNKHRKSDFKEIIEMPYELGTMNVPKGYDAVLTQLYGDYMQLVKCGADHTYPYFDKFEDMIEAQFGENIYRYTFDPKDIEDEGRKHEDSLFVKVSHFVTMACKVSEVLQVKINSNSYDGLDGVLQSCQTAAINTGELLENKMGYSTKTVPVLEQYCECVYQIYEALVRDDIDAVHTMIDAMNACVVELATCLETEIKEFKEVVFLVYHPKYWHFYEKRWKQAKDAGYKVSVISVPYFEVLVDGSFGTMHCDMDGYPDYVETIGYKEYDFESNHPDVIYIQNPYDRCNRVVSVPPYYYASNLRAHTEQLVYIPFFIIDEIDNDLAKSTMKYFCKVPGVVVSDLVLVQSEAMRQSYVECLTEISGEAYREVWEKKIQVNLDL